MFISKVVKQSRQKIAPIRKRTSMEDPTLTEYRRVSVLAILALILGLAASGALIGGVLYAVPVAGLGVGLLALAKIKSSAGNSSGRALAQWGIFFSVLFGVAAVAHPLLYQELIGRQSRSFGQSWLELLTAGDAKQALAYVDMQTKGQLVPRKTREKPVINDDFKAKIFQAFQQEPVVQQLQAAGKQAHVRYQQTLAKPQLASRFAQVTQIFSILGNDSASVAATGNNPAASPRPFYVRLHLKKIRSAGTEPALWVVSNWKTADTPSELLEP